MGSLVITISVIMGVIAVGLAFIMFLPAVNDVAYVSDAYKNLPISFQIMRDQLYEILLGTGAIIGLGVGALYVFTNAGKTGT